MNYRRQQFLVIFSILSTSALLTCGALSLLAIVIFAEDSSLDAEHRQLIEGLKRGDFKQLDEITPAPVSICDPSKMINPPAGTAYTLFYHLPKSRTLIIHVDIELHLIAYHIDSD